MKVQHLEPLIWTLGAIMLAASGIILGNAAIINSVAESYPANTLVAVNRPRLVSSVHKTVHTKRIKR